MPPYTTLPRDILLIGNRWRIQGEFRAVSSPKTQSGLSPPPTVDRCDFFYSFRCFFLFTDMNIFLSLWHCQIVYFWRFLRFKISTFSSGSQNLSEIGYRRIQDRLKTSFIIKKRTFIFYTKNSNFRHFLDDFGEEACLFVGV